MTYVFLRVRRCETKKSLFFFHQLSFNLFIENDGGRNSVRGPRLSFQSTIIVELSSSHFLQSFLIYQNRIRIRLEAHLNESKLLSYTEKQNLNFCTFTFSKYKRYPGDLIAAKHCSLCPGNHYALSALPFNHKALRGSPDNAFVLSILLSQKLCLFI